MLDAEQVYKKYISQTFNRAAPSYDHIGPRFFSHFGKRLVEVAGIGNGASALDIGCGRGAILFPAIECVGPSGMVIGIDIAETMLHYTANEIENLDCLNAGVYNMDAEVLGFPDDSFGFVICGLGLYELYDLDPALSEAFRVLKTGGVFAASVWGKNIDTRWDGLRSIVKSYRKQLKPAPEARNVPRLREPAEIEAVLKNAGFINIQTMVDEKEFYFKDVDEWWSFEWSHGNRFLWERMENSVLEHCRRELFEFVGGLKQEYGIPIVFQILLARAEKHNTKNQFHKLGR